MQRSWNYAASCLICASLLVTALAARAQDQTKPWERSIAVGFSLATGNTDTLLFNAGLKGEKLWLHDELRLGISGSYGRNNGSLSTELLQGVGQYKHLFDDRLYATLVADAIHDTVGAVAYRVVVGPGVGYYFIKSDVTRLNLEAGPSVIFEKVEVLHPTRPPPNRLSNDDRTYIAARVGERFDHKFNDGAKCWQQTQWLPQVDDFNNYLLISEAGVEASITKAMSLRLVGTHRYDNFTPDRKRHYDLTLVSSLAYKF